MESSIGAILAKLSSRFVPDMSLSRNLTSDEARCYSVIEEISVNFSEGDFVEEIVEYVSCTDGDSQSEDSAENLSEDSLFEPDLPCKEKRIESRFLQGKMDDIRHQYQVRGSLSTQKNQTSKISRGSVEATLRKRAW